MGIYINSAIAFRYTIWEKMPEEFIFVIQKCINVEKHSMG